MYKMQETIQMQSKVNNYYIGIDPDVDKSGVALLETETRKLTVKTLCFAELIDYLKEMEFATSAFTLKGERKSMMVIIEAGWMNRGNWHLQRWDGRASAAAKGVSQGRNEQVSRLLGEMCGHLGIPYEFKRPLPKCWGGHDRKITQRELEEITGQKVARTNQEGRDAALLAWDKAGFPMRIHVKPVSARKNTISAKELREALNLSRK